MHTYSVPLRLTKTLSTIALYIAANGLGMLYAQTSSNMEFFGNLNTRPDTTIVSQVLYSAVWGYVAADGHEYALLGCPLGTQVVDIQGPTLVECDFVPGPRNSWREMKTYTHYAFIVSEAANIAAGGGLQIVDLQYLPDSVHLVKTYVWTDSIPRPSIHSISQNGHFLYLNGGNFQGVRILDISDPENPVKAGTYSGPYIHDSHIRNDTLYGAAINSGQGVDIVNVGNKAAPTRIKLLQYPGSGTHNSWTSADGKTLFTTDEVGTTTKSLKVWNMTNIQNPFQVTEAGPTLGLKIVHNVFVKGTLAYVAWYTAGLRVIDVSNPSSPVQVAYYDSYPANNDSIFNGNWGADPFLPSGKVILSDMKSGLYVVRYTGDRRGIVVGTVRDGSTNQPVPGVVLHFKGQPSLSRWTGSDGKYIFGFAPGVQTAEIERAGYITKNVQITVPDTGTTTFDFTIDQIATAVQDPVEIPTGFVLEQNYPNPFNPSSTIRFTSPIRTIATLRVYNVLGQEIAHLFDGIVEPGVRSIVFDAKDLPSGIYFYMLRTPTFTATKKLVVNK